MLSTIEQRLASELAVESKQVIATINLLDDGATVPFIARYRKEVTGGLNDCQLRLLAERLHYLRDLDKRRASIIIAIEKQNKMTPNLLNALMHAENKTHLEDLYLPYRIKRRTKAQIAQEAGLQPLAEKLLCNPMLQPEKVAITFLKEPFTTDQGNNPGIKDSKEALDGARQILMEKFSEDATLLQLLREYIFLHGIITSKVIEKKTAIGIKFSDYFNYSESVRSIPSHRILALFRGRREKILTLSIHLDSETKKSEWDTLHNPCELLIAQQLGIKNHNRPADQWLSETIRFTWRTKIFPHLETDLMNALWERAEDEAVNIFARNLKALLLASPAGPHVTIGLDPGLRTGVKIAIVDATGKIMETAVIYPHPPRNDWDDSLSILKKLVEKHRVTLAAIGNGTASRETDRLIKNLIKQYPELKLTSVIVSEAGASVYSASQLASLEMPDIDVSLRGAASIARRLQDPLAELVKIDPKSIGIGQYQHDIDQSKLARSLDAVVEDCVNAVGVDVNTASSALLKRVSGIGSKVAQNIVTHRDAEGMFVSRTALLKVPHLGEKTFEQAAGFLRIMHGNNPLDSTAVHPESYPLVNKILVSLKADIQTLMGNISLLKSLSPSHYIDKKYGVPTISDILKELEKPGRDPRPAFTNTIFKAGVEELTDLQPNMILDGVITNVAAFGVFVDIGVHQDGLVHISALANTFVRDPSTIVEVGQVVKVKILAIDLERKRITLTMRLTDTALSNH